jgi:hypothetical protein
MVGNSQNGGGACMPIDLRARLETPELAAFRREVAGFVARELPDDIRRKVATERMDLSKEDQRRWHRILRRRGWACPSWPREFGGPGFSLEQQYVFERELALADAPRTISFGVQMLGPTLMRHGTVEQQRRFLPGILDAETFWCQGFSEPNAGSDLAALQCRAERRGERYVVNGTKMWTTEAHIADWMFGLFRTDSSGRKQQGITFLLLDLKSPGITVRPIVTFDGAGAEVNQAFFDDVEVPFEQRVGAEHQGWAVAKDLLALERFGIAEISRSLASLRRLRQLLGPGPSPFIDRLIDLEVELAAIEATELKLLLCAPGGAEPGAEAALLKLRGTEIQNAIFELTLDVLGPLGHVDAGDLDGATQAPAEPPAVRHAARTYYNFRKTMIYGGSNEIQKNILAKAILGL